MYQNDLDFNNIRADNITMDQMVKLLIYLLNKINDLELEFKNKPLEQHTKDKLTSEEAADYLGITIQTLYSKTTRDNIPHMSICGKSIYHKKDLEKYIKEKGKADNHETSCNSMYKVKGYLKKQ
jgi:hypothetical protein